MKLDLTTAPEEKPYDDDNYTMTVTIPPLIVTMSRSQYDPDGGSTPGLVGLAQYMAENLDDYPWAAVLQFVGDWSLQDDDSFDDWSDDIVFDLVRGPG